MYAVIPRGGLLPYFADEVTESMKYQVSRGLMTILDLKSRQFLGQDGEFKSMCAWNECEDNIERFPSRGFYL